MAENTNPEDSSILGILENETESERVGSAQTSTERLDLDEVTKKANDKYNMMEVPTERKVAEDKAKLAGQINTAETHQVLGGTISGNVNPEHRTYDGNGIGLPLAAPLHDYDSDRIRTVEKTTSTKEDPEIKKLNEQRKQIVDNINKENEKANK